MKQLTPYLVALLALLIQSCSMNSGRYQQAHDSTPTRLPTASELKDPIPRFEPKSRGGNMPSYKVRGKTYYVMPSADGFTQTGIASWYGNKFHGHLTSNGEIYDMYAMSAAHKNLPIPTYAKVTNLANNKSVIVRVNDRGPFHESRVIDLSFSAAYKLDMLKTGTAKVKIEAITEFGTDPKRNESTQTVAQSVQPTILPMASNTSSTAAVENLSALQEIPSINNSADSADTTGNNSNVANSANYFIQVFATRSADVAKNTANALSTLYQQNVVYPEQNGIYRVQIGPFKEGADTSELIDALKASGYENAYRRKILH